MVLSPYGRLDISHARFSVRGTILAASAAVLIMASGVAAAEPGVATLATPAPPGASPAPNASQPPTDPQEAMLAFVQCMRDHGVDMPDPQFSDDGNALIIGGTADGSKSGTAALPIGGPGDPKVDAAQEACHSLLPPAVGNADPAEQAEMQQRALDFAKCMRDHGVDMPDPQFEGNGGILQMMPESRDLSAMEAASTACQGFMPGPPGGPSVDSAPGGGTVSGGSAPVQVTR